MGKAKSTIRIIQKQVTVHYDNQIFRRQKFGGISHYFAELIDRLPEYGVHPWVQSPYTYNENYQRIGEPSFLEKLVGRRYFKGRDRLKMYLQNQSFQKLKRELASGKITVFHPSYYEDYYLNDLHPDIKLVLTVHDMTHELYIAKHAGHEDFMEIRNKRKLLPRADKIIAISENTRQDMLQLFSAIDPGKIEVIHHGIQLPEHRPESKGDKSDYLLFVGNRSGYKNFRWLVENLRAFMVKEQMKLICYGSAPFSQEETKFLQEKGWEKVIIHQPFSFQDDLYKQYQGAFAFLFPSAYEGFGYPILEAFVNACPVILPRASCFPEVGGDGAIYYDLDNQDQLLEAIKSLKDPELRRAQVEKGWERVQTFSIEASVAKHATLYHNLLQHH